MATGPDLPPGPILIAADNEAIARWAVRWAEIFADQRPYRVRLLALGNPAELRAVAAEARSLAAVAVVAAGGPTVRDLAGRAAAAAGLPLVVWSESAGG